MTDSGSQQSPMPELPPDVGAFDADAFKRADPVEVTYFRGARPIAGRTLALACMITGGVVLLLTLLALITGSGALTTLLLIGLGLACVALMLLPRALKSTRVMLWLTSRPSQLASILPRLDVLTPWARPENGRVTPPDDLTALVAELSREATVTLGGLDGFTATQQVFATDIGQKVLDQYPPGPPMMGSSTRTKVAPRSAS